MDGWMKQQHFGSKYEINLSSEKVAIYKCGYKVCVCFVFIIIILLESQYQEVILSTIVNDLPRVSAERQYRSSLIMMSINIMF